MGAPGFGAGTLRLEARGAGAEADGLQGRGELRVAAGTLPATVYSPVTGPGFNDFHPSFSPDGQRIVFSSDRAGGSQLFVCTRSGGGWGSPVAITSGGSNKKIHSGVWSNRQASRPATVNAARAGRTMPSLLRPEIPRQAETILMRCDGNLRRVFAQLFKDRDKDGRSAKA